MKDSTVIYVEDVSVEELYELLSTTFDSLATHHHDGLNILVKGDIVH